METKLAKISSKKNLLSILEAGDKMEVAVYMGGFKERGVVMFREVLSVPSSERIPVLATTKEGKTRLLIALSASLRSALKNINLRIGLNEDQIISLAGKIIDTAYEDNLGLEDVLLFLDGLITGNYGKIYDRLDAPTFFELFENYRQERHEALQRIRYEQDANYKSLGPTERASEDTTSERDAHRSALSEHMKHIYKSDQK
jgi:hypothetical protein